MHSSACLQPTFVSIASSMTPRTQMNTLVSDELSRQPASPSGEQTGLRLTGATQTRYKINRDVSQTE